MNERKSLVSGVLALCFLLALLPAAEGQRTKTTVVVEASKPLNDSRLFIQAGDTVRFKAQGRWTVNLRENVPVGPDGEVGTSALRGYELPGAPVGALLAVVSGKRYLVGSKSEITFEQSGQLFLTANAQSKLSAYMGNQGNLTVEVEVSKAAAAGIAGRYSIAFEEDRLILSSGGEKKVLPVDAFRREKIRNEWGETVVLPENMAEHLKALSKVIQLEVKGVHVFVSDPEDPQKPAQKGLYIADKQEFLIHLEGTFKPAGTCLFLYTKNISGRLSEAGRSLQIRGEVNLTLTLACKGPRGQPGKGKILNLALPFSGTGIQTP